MENKVLIINGKEYKYKLTRKHVFMFSKIIDIINFDINVGDGDSDNIGLGIGLFKSILAKLYLAEIESLEFISNAYQVSSNDVFELGYQNEIKMWWHLFANEKDFFMNLLKSEK